MKFSPSLLPKGTHSKNISINGVVIPVYRAGFWTAKQRQGSPLHEISYRACFKAQLPKFFIERFSKENDIVYDPFSGRGTTVIEAGLLRRNAIANDINPLSALLSLPRFFIPTLAEIEKRLSEIPPLQKAKEDIDLSMFFHKDTLTEIISLKNYLTQRNKNGGEDYIDRWIRMVATNRLTGHSNGFFSVYTLPPNQATSRESQIKINIQRKQTPEYRDIRKIILKKSRSLLRGITLEQVSLLKQVGKKSLFITGDARKTKKIKSGSVQLTVTSPPFLDIVDYANDNWLRWWFNGLDSGVIRKKVTMSHTIEDWSDVMGDVFTELYRVTKRGGYVAFEVGELRKGTVKLEESVVPLGIRAGFVCEAIFLNEQSFTKTSNIWGVKNNSGGTNSNRIVLFKKST